MHGQPINFTLDFEDGNLRGWEQTGNAFRFQPALGDNPTARQCGQPSNHQGRYWIGTYERYHGKPGQEPGDIQGDRPTGTLTSSTFTIPSGTLSFLVGGGSSSQTRVELLIIEGTGEFNERRVLNASGRNTETMHRVTWELTPYAGKTGLIRIVDASSGGWGHINVDDFRFGPSLEAGTAYLRLRLESSPPFQVGRPIRFGVRVEPEYPGLQYQFRFGDGSVSDWMSENNAEHVYSRDGMYQVVAVARATEERAGLTRAPAVLIVTSNTVPVEVQAPPSHVELFLRADRDRVQAGQSVRFTAVIRPEYRNAEYRFDFGDGAHSEWTGVPGIEHAYESSGRYQAFVTLRKGTRVIAESNTVQVEVTPVEVVPGRYKVFLEADKQRSTIDEVLIFRGYVRPPRGNVQYQFDFGDRALSEWLAEPVTSHAYNNPGTYNAYLTAKIGEELFRSDKIALTVIDLMSPHEGKQNGGTGSLFFPSWVKVVVIIIGVLVASGGGYYLFSRIKRTKNMDKHFMPTVQIRPKKDIGTQEIESDFDIKSDFEVRLRPISDHGKQDIETDGSLIMDKRRENE